MTTNLVIYSPTGKSDTVEAIAHSNSQLALMLTTCIPVTSNQSICDIRDLQMIEFLESPVFLFVIPIRNDTALEPLGSVPT